MTLIGRKFLGSDERLPVLGIIVILAIFQTDGRVLVARLWFIRVTIKDKKESGRDLSIELWTLLKPGDDDLPNLPTCFLSSARVTSLKSTASVFNN